MHRRRTGRAARPGTGRPDGLRAGPALALAAVLAGAALVPGPAAAHAAEPASEKPAAVASIQAPDPAKVHAYWTPERKRRARPLGASAPAHPEPGVPAAEGGRSAQDGKSEEWPGDVETPPRSSSGRLYFTTSDGEMFWCSAATVGSPGRNLVITAAQCLYDDPANRLRAWHEHFEFEPGYTDDSLIGSWEFTRAFVPRAWVESSVVAPADAYNVGMLTVGVDNYGRRLQDVTGGNGISFETAELGRAVSAFGYHVSSGPSTLRRCAGDIGFGSAIGEYRLHCDLDHGAIGGPWLSGFAGVDEGGTGTGTIISVTSRTSFVSGDMHGPSFGPQIRQLYQSAISAEQRPAFVPLGGKDGLTTGIQLQNPNPDGPVTVRVEYVAGTRRVTDPPRTIRAGGSVTLYDQGPPGTSGVVVTPIVPPTGQVNAIANHIDRGRRAVASSNGFAAGSRRVLLPLLMNGNAGLDTWISVQNLEPRQVRAQVTYRDRTGPLRPSDSLIIDPGASQVVRQGGTPLPKVFAGEVIADGDIAVTVFQESRNALLEYAGFPADAAALDLAAPLIMADNFGTITGIQIQNPGGEPTSAVVAYTANQATIETGAKHPCGGTGWQPDPRRVPIQSGAAVTMLQHAPDGQSEWKAGDPTWDPQFRDCRYIGSATITADDPVVAIVNQAGAGASSAYEAVARATADNRIELPLVQGYNPRSMSGIQIQNLGPQAVSAHLDYSDNVYTQDFSTPGSTPACVPVDRDLPVPGNGSETVLLGAHDKAVDWSRDHGCTYIGSLTITSPDGTSIAALANQVAGDGSNDQLSTYNG